MSSIDQFKQISHKYWIQKRTNGNMVTNNIKSYSLKASIGEYNDNTSHNIKDGVKYSENTNQSSISNSLTRNNNGFSIINNKSMDKNNNIYKSEEMRAYVYSSGTDNTIDSNKYNLKHHPNQVNNLIHNHKYYSSKTTNSKDAKKLKSSKTIKTERTEKYQRTPSLSPIIKNKNEVDSKKAEYEGKLRYSTVSNTSGETNISISKTQLKKLMTNMWLEEIYCSNVESLCCLVDSNNKNNSSYLIEIHEKELENNALKIKDYEAEIIKLKSILNIKEKEMKKLLLNLKQSESTLKLKNKKIYELNKKSEKTKEEFEKDTHELQIISAQQDLKKYNIDLDKDAISLQILSMKKGWNDTNVPSPINEIYIETLKHEYPQNKKKYEEMWRIMKRKEEEIIRKKIEMQSKLEIQEMGLLSIISKKPKKNNLFQRLESIMILSTQKEKKSTLMFQKIEDIAIESNSIKVENEIQELDGLEIINIKKNKEKILQEQCLNGLEIRRDYDMLLVKPVWESLKVQGTGLNLLAIKKEVELENQEIDEFEILANEKPENIMEKVNNFKITGKIKLKVDYRINKERIKLIGLPKKEKNWNEMNIQIKSSKLLIKRDYDRIEPKIYTNWDDVIKPIKTTKLLVKSEKPKINKLNIGKGEKFNFLYSTPIKEEYDIENFNINLINSEKKSKTLLKMTKGGFNIKGKKKEKIQLIKNRMDSINIFGLKDKKILIPFSQDHIYLASQLKIDSNKNWNNINKIIKSKELKIPRKNKIKNIISKKVVNVEIKLQKKANLKPIKLDKFLIKGINKEIIEKPELKEIKTNRLFIRAFKKIEKKPEIILKQKKEMKLLIKGIKKEEPQIPDWNDINKFKKENSIKLIGKKLKKVEWNRLIKMEKKPSINYIYRAKKLILKKQNLCAFAFKGMVRIEEKESEKFEIVNNWANSLKAQRNAKFNLKGKVKTLKLIISKGDKFTIKREPEDEIIYNDDYNYLSQKKTENGKENEKVVMIKEKEVTPILHREIRAQVVKVKEESSETSSQSDVDILAGIKKKKMLAISSGKGLSTSGFNKKIINGEVIFSPKNSLGVNLGGAKYKKEILIKKQLQLYNKTEHNKISGIEISGNNGEIHSERMSGIGGTIKEGNYQIINGSFSYGLNDQIKSKNKLKTISQSSSNFMRVHKKSREPCDSKKKSIKRQLVIKSREIGNHSNEITENENMSHTRILTSGNFNYGSKKIIFNSNLASGNIKHSASTYGINNIKSNTISKRKEETISYGHKDNENFIKKKIKKNVNPFEN